MTIASEAVDDLLLYPGFGLKIVASAATSAATASSVSPRLARYASMTTFFQDKYFWFPTAAAADDQVRSIVSHAVTATSTVFTFDDTSNFAENLTNVVAYILPVHPDTLLSYMQKAQEETHVIVDLPIYHLPASGGMMGSAVDTDFTESNATDSTQTTDSEVWAGAQSFLVTDSGSGGGYTQSALYPIGTGERVVHHAIMKANAGESIKDQLLDGSGGEVSSIATAQRQWVYGRKVSTVGSSVNQLRKRLTVVTASGAGDWQASWAVRLGELVFRLPSWIGDRFTVEGLTRGVFHEPVTDSSGDQQWLADSMEPRSLVKGFHWQVFKRTAAANTRFIRILDKGVKYMEDPLFVRVRCPWSDPYGVSTLLTSYTATTQMPLDLLVAKTKAVMGSAQDWPQMEAEGAAGVIKHTVIDEAETQTEEEETESGWAGAFA